ncbi:hypothetical protein IBTHAUMO2_910001 [Nitrosopumilaceae archaeon]|nr:hypothetical protein [Alphaproteobacteria bacterium]CAI9832654.1 hypothetical protein IBTHAUMO2_910001 [Nitrosopumilaceae archaeon]
MMDIKYIGRRAQKVRNSFIVNIPADMARELELEQNPNLKVTFLNKMVIIKAGDSKITKKDMTDAAKIADAEPAPEEEPAPEDGSYMKELNETMGPPRISRARQRAKAKGPTLEALKMRE